MGTKSNKEGDLEMGYAKKVMQTQRYLWDFANGTGADGSTATGTIPIFSMPANSVVYGVQAYVIAAVTGSSAEEVGDGTDVDGYIVDNFAAGTGFYPTSAEAATCGVFQKVPGTTDAADVAPEYNVYASADTIDYKITGTATAGKILFLVHFAVLA